MHELGLISTLVGGLAVALVLGWWTQRLGLSTLVGYMLAGIVVGPYTPGFVADGSAASQLAEIGVILLMFSVGMHFHPQELLKVWRIAVPGAIAQSALAAVAGWAAARWFGWGDVAGVVFGMALAVASTVVLMRMLVEQNRLSSHDGHVAVGWLIVEDLFTVLALVVLPALASLQTTTTSNPSAGNTTATLATELLFALGKAALFAGIVWGVGSRLVRRLMDRVARTHSSELFTLAIFVVALGIALIAATVFHVSVALGAFLGGLVVGQSRFGAQAAADMAPFRDVFSALFFVSVGMLFNPGFVLEEPGVVLIALAIVLLLKPLVAVAIVRLLRDSGRTAATVGVGLAQIGEFSFILGTLGVSLKLLPQKGMDALVVVALMSIALNPLLFRWLAWLEKRRGTLTPPAAVVPTPANTADTPASIGGAPVVITGLGDIGRRVLQRCVANGIAVLVIDRDLDLLEEQRAQGVLAVFGDATRSDVLAAAGVSQARALVVTNSSLPDKLRICAAVHEANPRIAVIATAMTGAERAWLEETGVPYICDGLDEMTDSVLRSIRSAL